MTEPQPGRTSATERAYDYAKRCVLDGTFPAGELLSEGEVATALGLSRTPVREAFLRLQAEGMLKLYPKRGALVVPISRREVEAVLEARELIETFAARKAIAGGQQHLSSLLADLRASLEEQQHLRAVGDERGFVAADRNFHSLVVDAADNPILSDLYGSLRDRQLRMGLTALGTDPDRLRTIGDEHAALVSLLAEGDLDAYQRLLRQHLSGTRSALGQR
jgi:DNA-binding GntR family transcriptional regulator